MKRLGELDFPDRVAGLVPTFAAQVVFAVFCFAIAVVTRIVSEIWWPGAAPFALTFPVVLIATLFARWQAGVITLALVVMAAWYFVLPPRFSFALDDPRNAPHILVSTIAGLGIIAIAELFRRAVRRAVAERDERIGERDLYLREFDHRVKNNFASVISLIDLQRRRAGDAATREALGEALGRVESIARAHNALYRAAGSVGTVDIKPYGEELSAALSTALFLRGSIRLECRIESAILPRDRVISIGLLINELVTNSAKHAFVGRDSGRIEVEFRRTDEGFQLSVSDDGVGMTKSARAGLGTRLVAAFARDAGGTVQTATSATGTAVSVALVA
jgi:two-component sensor histidine kinase